MLMCVQGKLDEYVGEMFLHLQNAGLKPTVTCVSHVCSAMRDLHRGGEAFDNAGGKLEVRFAVVSAAYVRRDGSRASLIVDIPSSVT